MSQSALAGDIHDEQHLAFVFLGQIHFFPCDGFHLVVEHFGTLFFGGGGNRCHGGDDTGKQAGGEQSHRGTPGGMDDANGPTARTGCTIGKPVPYDSVAITTRITSDLESLSCRVFVLRDHRQSRPFGPFCHPRGEMCFESFDPTAQLFELRQPRLLPSRA